MASEGYHKITALLMAAESNFVLEDHSVSAKLYSNALKCCNVLGLKILKMNLVPSSSVMENEVS